MKKLFFDTDVILDLSIARDINIDASVKVINLVENGLFEGHTSSLVFSNIFYIQRKIIGRDKAIGFLKNLRLLLTVLNVDDLIIQQALESEFSDFEDAIQYFTATKNNMDCIITRNISDFRKSTMPVYTPTEFLKTFDKR